MKQGLIIILSGASSVGKSMIRDQLLNNPALQLFYSVSMTTRPPKENEVDGKDYYFVNHEVFAKAVREHDLLEFTEFSGYYYGTPSQIVDFLVSNGKNVLIEVEAQGVAQIRLARPNSIAFFIVPETMEELEKQIRMRYKDDETSIQQRLNKAKMEMELAPLFKHVVKNSDPTVATDTIIEAIKHYELK